VCQVKLIDYIGFYVSLKNISLIWRRHHCRWRAAKFRNMLGAQGFWAGRDLYRSTPAVTRDLGLSGLIRRTASYSRLLRHTRGCGGFILTRILTGCQVRRWCLLSHGIWSYIHFVRYLCCPMLDFLHAAFGFWSCGENPLIRNRICKGIE
jgi:hypothetical protein